MRLPRQIKRYGPDGLLLNWEQKIAPDINISVHAYADRLREHPAVLACIPAYCSLLIRYLPPKITAYKLREYIYSLDLPERERTTEVTHELPVCYDVSLAPDLEDTAETLGISTDRLIELHTSTSYLVYQIGFRPGFGFLGETPTELLVPRLEQPRRLVPAGSVGLAGRQTGVYPEESPGGWRLIGRCPLDMTRPGRDFSRLHPGDCVRFHPISLTDFAAFKDDQPWPKR